MSVVAAVARTWPVSYSMAIYMFRELNGYPFLQLSAEHFMLLPMNEYFRMMQWYQFTWKQACEVAFVLRRVWFGGQVEVIVVPYVWATRSPSPHKKPKEPTIICECVLIFLERLVFALERAKQGN